MSNCGHGHVYPRSDGIRARCGGPAICPDCARDQIEKQRTEQKLAEKQLKLNFADILSKQNAGR